MGIVDGNEESASGLGVECSGVVKSLGPDVVDLQVGDRVAAIATSSYSTVLKTPADMCVKIPDNLSFEEAATMPSVFGTVIYGLLHLANLEAGQVSKSQGGEYGTGASNSRLCINRSLANLTPTDCAYPLGVRWHWHRSDTDLPGGWCGSLRNGRK